MHFGALQPQLVVEYPVPRAAVMEGVADEVSPLLQRLDADARAQLFGRREVRVRRPARSRRSNEPSTLVDTVRWALLRDAFG